MTIETNRPILSTVVPSLGSNIQIQFYARETLERNSLCNATTFVSLDLVGPLSMLMPTCVMIFGPLWRVSTRPTRSARRTRSSLNPTRSAAGRDSTRGSNLLSRPQKRRVEAQPEKEKFRRRVFRWKVEQDASSPLLAFRSTTAYSPRRFIPGTQARQTGTFQGE